MKHSSFKYCIALMASFILNDAIAGSNAEELGAVFAPTELIAEYTCISYVNADVVVGNGRRENEVTSATDRRQALRRLLSDYNSLLKGMCKEFREAFAKAHVNAAVVYGKQIPGSDSDIQRILAAPNLAKWAAENNAFLQRTAALVALYVFAVSRAPDLISTPDIHPKSPISVEVVETSIGRFAKDERLMLIQLTTDKEFAALLPREFDLASIAAEEQRLRKEAAKLRLSTWGWPRGNPSDLVRMHFASFEVMRDIGLQEIALRYQNRIDQIALATGLQR